MASLAEFLQAQQQFQNQPTAFDYMSNIAKASMIPAELGMKGLEARQKFEDYENTQKLRKLFAESAGMPDIAQVGQYSPDMAIKLQQAMLDNAVKQQQMRESGMRTGKIGQEIQLEKGKAFANTIGPYGDQYYMDRESGMPEGQALNKFRMSTGQALQQLEAQGMSPDVPFDMDQLTPDAALRAASGHGYNSRYLQSQQKIGEESAMRRLPPAPTPQQAYGGYHTTPEGYNVPIPPVMGGGQAPGAPEYQPPFEDIEKGPPTIDQGQNNIDFLRSQAQSLPKGSKERKAVEDELTKEIKRVVAMRQPSPAMPGSVVTPEQLSQKRLEEEAAKTEVSETAKAKVAQAEARKQKADVLSSLPKVPELNDLIDKSISGQIEAIGKGKILGEMAGIPSEALDATKQLEIVAAQMKQITKSLVGAGAVSDFEQRQMAEAAGNIADPRTPAKTRKLQLGMFNRILRKSLNKSPEFAKGLNEPQEDDAIESEPAEAPSIKRGTKPKIGQIESGYMFKGGNPADPNNWEKQ